MFDLNLIEGDDEDRSHGGRDQCCSASPTGVNVS